MGCKLTKDETIVDPRDSSDMSKSYETNGEMPSAATIKSRIEKKICLVRTYSLIKSQ